MTPSDYFVMACEIIFIGFIVYYIIEEALEFKKFKWAFFNNVWNILDLIVIAVSIDELFSPYAIYY